jgi:hypothetical protein
LTEVAKSVDLGGGGSQLVIMASTKTLNAKNLEALGAGRLASLLIEISNGNSVAKRRLRLELAGAAGGDDAAREIHKRITSIAKARTFIDWQKTKAMVTDLEAQHRAILEHVSKTDPGEALSLLWRFLGLAEAIFARCDDGSGRVVAVFRNAIPDLATLAASARATPAALATSTFEALKGRNHGQWDDLIGTLAPQLGAVGLAQLRSLVESWRSEQVEIVETTPSWRPGPAESERLYASQIEARHRQTAGRFALEQLADAQGDVDGYIAQQPLEARAVPRVAASIARRLLSAGRAGEALNALDQADLAKTGWIPEEWEDARIEALETLGRAEAAQSFRWERFSTGLSVRHLRAWLRKLPGFDDFEGEERALAHVATFPDVHRAAAFLIAWRAFDRASALVLARARELNGDLYETLTSLAEALEPSYPLAATLALRAMIRFTLVHGRSSRYVHARRHFDDCASLSARIEDFGDFPDHATYERQLRAVHGRKTGFWQLEG